MNAKKQTPLNPQIRLAAEKGFKGGQRRGYWARLEQYSDPQSRLPIFSGAIRGGGHEHHRL